MARPKNVDSAVITSSRPTKSTVSVANKTQGRIIFPEKSTIGNFAPPLILEPGCTTEVDGQAWAIHKEGAMLKNYMDAGFVTEEDAPRAVVATEAATVDLVVPEHLAGDDFDGGVTAKIMPATNVRSVTL